MLILLITTLPNRVYDALSEIDEVELHIVDCVDYKNIESRVLDEVFNSEFDVLITYRCPYIVPQEVINRVKDYNTYNIHPSLLPKYSGLNPWGEIMRSEDSESGVTLHRLTNIVDGGEIIVSKSFKLCRDEDLEYNRTLSDKVAGELVRDFYFDNLLMDK